MKIFDDSNFISQFVAWIYLILVSLKLTDILFTMLPMHSLNRVIPLLLYVFICLLLVKLYSLLYRFILSLVYYNKHRLITVVSLFLYLPVDIELSVKALKMLYYTRTERNYGKIIKYFDDKNDSVKYFALLLYGAQIDTDPVLNWFEERYIRNGIPIDSYFFPLYKIWFMSKGNA